MNEKKKLRRLPKRILSFVMTLAMVLTLMPGMSMEVKAATQSFKPTDITQSIDYIKMTNNHNGTVQFDELPSFEGNTMNGRTVYSSDLSWGYENGFYTSAWYASTGGNTWLANINEGEIYKTYSGATLLAAQTAIDIQNIPSDSSKENSSEIPTFAVVALAEGRNPGDDPRFFGIQVFTLPTKVIYNLNGGTAGTGFVSTDWIISGKEWLTNNNVVNHTIAPKKTGYTFDGWYTGATNGTKVETTAQADAVATFPTSGTGCRSVTLYAHWKAHTHSWQYNATSNKLEAYCATEGCDNYAASYEAAKTGGKLVTLTLTANNADYSDSKPTINVGSATERADWTSAELVIPPTSYEKEDGTALDSVPTEVGSYVAKVTVEGQTAQVSFTIQQSHEMDTSKYAADDSHHWRPCLRTDCNDETHKYYPASHSYDNDTHKCLCGKTDPDIHKHSFATAWSTDDDNHWHACTVEGSSNDCLIDVAAAKAPHGSWNDGKCGTCGYVCQHNGATSGVCGICTKDLDSGSTPKPNPTPGGDHSNAENAAAPTIPTDYVAERVAEEEAMEVTVVTIDTTQYSKNEETVVPGTSYNLSKFITTKGIVKGIKTAVAAANKDKKDTIEIYTGKPFCFNKEIIKTIQESKKTVVYYFHYKGHIYSVTVPATVDASKVLEKAGFAGPLYVGKVLGTTKLIK